MSTAVQRLFHESNERLVGNRKRFSLEPYEKDKRVIVAILNAVLKFDSFHGFYNLEKRAAKTGEKPLMTNFAVYNLDRNNCFDYSKAERELGYRTRPYAETLRDEASWLVAEGKIKGNLKFRERKEENRNFGKRPVRAFA